MRPRVALVLASLLLAPLLADEVELTNGSSFQGRIVEETDDSVSIDVGAGVMKFEKSGVKRISRDGAKHGPSTGGAAPSGAIDVPQGLEGDLAATVGPGGVTVEDLAKRVEGRSRGDYTLEDAPPEMRRQWLDEMIDEELLFQGAIADGLFADPEVRRRLCEAQLAAQGVDTGIGSAKSITDEDLFAWYQAHKADLVEAKRLFVRGTRVIDFTTGEGDPALVEGSWSTDEYAQWIEKLKAAKPGDPIWDVEGWVSATEELMGPRTFTMLKTVRAGGFSNAILCSDRWLWVFYVDAREDAGAPPAFEECKERIRVLAWGDRRKGIDALINDDLYRTALEARQHRKSYQQTFLVQTYVDRRKKTRDELLAEMRQRFRVDVLLGE